MSSAAKHVASRANPLFKQLRADARGGGRAGAPIWLDGVHLCEEYLQRVGEPRLAVFDAARVAAGDPALQALRAAVSAHKVVTLADDLLEGVSDIAGAQGVGFLADAPVPAKLVRVAVDCVVLDRVQDPGNVGSILRTCAAAGVGTVLLTPGCAAAWSPKVLRAAQGAHFALTVYEGIDIPTLVDTLGVPLLATSLDRAAGSLYDTELPQPAAWCFGHEGQGVDPTLLAQAAWRIAIPQASGVESLNVAAAAAVCLFEQRRRRLGR